MARQFTQQEIQQLVHEYKRTADREERLETAATIGEAVRDLAEALVDHYPNQVGTDALSTLFRLCQIPEAAALSTKHERIEALDLPEAVTSELKETVPDAGIVGGGQAQLPVPADHEDAVYDFLEVLVTADDQQQLDAAIDEFAALDLDRLQAGVLSPILYFLHPSKYPIINQASREGMQALFDYEVSGQLTAYTTEAERFREVRDTYELGGETGDLRDLDWFFYSVDTQREPAVWVEKTRLHADYKEPGSGDLALGRALISPQGGSDGRDIYGAMRNASVGDLVVHILQDKQTIAGVSVIQSDLITDYEFPEEVTTRWDASQREQGGYLRRLTDFQALDDPPHIYDDVLQNPAYSSQLDAIYEAHSGLFYDTNRELAQGKYLTACPAALAQLFADVSPELAQYFEEHGLAFPSTATPQVFQIPLSTTQAMRENFETTVQNDVPADAIAEIVETTVDRETIRVWASGAEPTVAQPGDLLLFADRDTDQYITAATVAETEYLSEAAARAFSEAVGWEYAAQYRSLLYLDEVYKIDVDAAELWDRFDYDGFPSNGFSRIAPELVETAIIDSAGSVDAFLDTLAVEHTYPTEMAASRTTTDRTYYLWNTNYDHENTDGTAAFQRGVAAAYGDASYGEALTRPNQGDVLIAYLAGTGVVGVGEVSEETDGSPVDKSAAATNGIKGPETTEYHLPVDWLYTLPSASAIGIAETAELLNRDSMSHVHTIQEPSDQAGAEELYEVVRQRYLTLHEGSTQAAYQNTELKRLLEGKSQLVFYGPPGTGKTYTAMRFAEWLRAQRDANALGQTQIRSVTFHPSFAYEDFIEGFSASVVGQQVSYDYETGVFADIVAAAKTAYTNSPDPANAPPFILIIDEINRGNLAQIFGETITLLEQDKRLDQDNEVTTELAHSGDSFVIPPNLYIIGTMNTADESIALVDTALRRRFRFLSFPPQLAAVTNHYDALPSVDELDSFLHTDEGDTRAQLLAASIVAIRELNNRIRELEHLGKGKQIGHTHLFGLDTTQDIGRVAKSSRVQ